MAKEENNLHIDHRKRVKERFLERGLEGFFEHEVLELSLFYALPRQDTNTIAHRLIDRFGSISAVFEADISELQKIEAIGEHGASLLRLFSEVPRFAEKTRLQKSLDLRTHSSCVSYLTKYLKPLKTEQFHLLCLNAQLKLIKHITLFEGSVSRTNVNMRILVEQALRNQCSAAVIAHNHPSGSVIPSLEDNFLTESVFSALSYVDIRLLDHIIVGGDNFYSYKNQHIIDGYYQKQDRGVRNVLESRPDFE